MNTLIQIINAATPQLKQALLNQLVIEEEVHVQQLLAAQGEQMTGRAQGKLELLRALRAGIQI